VVFSDKRRFERRFSFLPRRLWGKKKGASPRPSPLRNLRDYWIGVATGVVCVVVVVVPGCPIIPGAGAVVVVLSVVVWVAGGGGA